VTTPSQGQFIIHRLWLPMVNLHTKFEVSTFALCKDMKGTTQNVKIGWSKGLGVTQGYWQCHHSQSVRLPIGLQ